MKLLVRGGGYTLFFIDLMGREDLKVEIERYLREIVEVLPTTKF